jgi:hypothetical protein
MFLIGAYCYLVCDVSKQGHQRTTTRARSTGVGNWAAPALFWFFPMKV